MNKAVAKQFDLNIFLGALKILWQLSELFPGPNFFLLKFIRQCKIIFSVHPLSAGEIGEFHSLISKFNTCFRLKA